MTRTSALAAAVLALALAGCTSHQTQPATVANADSRATTANADVPAMVGLAGFRAIDRLRKAGYENIAVDGRWSDQARGVIVAEEAASVATHGHRPVIRLVASMGPRERGHGLIFLPGVATCELSPLPKSAPCVGGPVTLHPAVGGGGHE